MNKHKFSIWIDYEDQWDAEQLPPPDEVVEAFNEFQAAEDYAEKHGSFSEDELFIIVRNEATQMYFRVELVKEWSWSGGGPVTLQDLCKQ